MDAFCGSVAPEVVAEAAVLAMHGALTDGRAPAFARGTARAALGASRGVVDGAVTVVGDVRLDNRDELRRALPGLAPSSEDITILLSAWRRWGVDCCEHLLGDFAFAVWDDAAGQLFLGRDLVGAKPLYYWAGPRGGFAFASELRGLLAHPDLERRLDTTAAVDFLLHLQHDVQRTLFEHVHRLPPGHALSVSAEARPRTWRHTALRPAAVTCSSLEGWAEALRAQLVPAVADRLRTAGRMGAHLSGGLDSSSVVALAASGLDGGAEQLVAVSFSAPPGTAIDGRDPVDAEFIRAVSAHLDLEVHHADVAGSFPDALRLASPGMMPPPYGTSPVHRWAADRGVGTILSGWGGDEAASFNGRSHLAEMLRRGRLLHLAATTRRLRPAAGPRGMARFLWKNAVVPLLPDAFVWRADRRRGDPLADRVRVSMVREAAARATGALDHVRHQLRVKPTTRATLLALLGDGHVARRIEAWSADASLYGIDYRYPLLDRRVLEVALAAPSEAFLHDGVYRWLFRAAVDPYLPATVVWRPGKHDSFSSRPRPPDPSAAVSGPWAAAQVDRMVAEGNDLGGIVDLGKLRQGLAPVADAGPGAPRLAGQAPAIATGLAVRLAAFVEHNKISV